MQIASWFSFSYGGFCFLFASSGREFCADFPESIQLMSSFFYKFVMLALVSKIGTINPAITDGVAPLRTD